MQIQEKQSSSEFKQKWFDFTKQLASNELSMNLYKFFIIIESLQFIGYHNNGLISYNIFGFSYLGKLLQFVNILPLMLHQNVSIILVPIFTVITVAHVVMIVIGYKSYHRKMERMSKSVEDRNFHKNRLEYLINLLMVCFNTILTIPVCQTSISSIYCLPSGPYSAMQNCYSTSQICIAILATINFAWLLLSNLYFSLYYFSRNPFSTNFLTCSSNWWNLGKFAIKITPVFYFSYDSQLAYPVLFLVMINACYGGYIGVFRILFPYYRYNFDLEKFIFFIEGVVLLVNVHFAVIYSVDMQFGSSSTLSIILLFWFVASIFFVKLSLSYVVHNKKQLIVDIHSLQKIKLDNVLEYLIYLIYEVEKSFKTNQPAFFIANIAKTHKEICQNVNCYCNEFFKMTNDKTYYKNKDVFYTLLLAIIDRVMAENKKAYPFFIMRAYILYYKKQSQIKAATTIAIIMQDKLDFSDEMLVKGLLFELNHQYTDTRDMEVYRKFNEYLLQQEEESMKLVNFYIQYWQELIDQNSSIPKLHRLLTNIKNSKEELNRIVQSSLGIFRNHVRVLLLYKNFLKEVLNDYMGYLRYEEKYKVGLKEHKLSNVDAVNTIQFRPNQNLLVINFTRHFSVHTEILGNFKIMSISSNVREFLGYTNSELKDQSINKLIPRIYHTIHDTIIDNILDKPDAEIVTTQYRIFPVNSEGYIIECNITSKFMPSVTCGINIVSFIEQCDVYKDEFFIIYDKVTGMVDSMNEGAEKMLKDASRRKTSEMLAIPDHINDLVPNWDYKNEIWREHIGRGKSSKSINSMNEFKYDVKEIEVLRSDGLESKFIKILKFKGDFFVRMFSFDNNYDSYKESNTIQQYLEYQKDNTYSKMDSNQLEDLISIETHHLIDRNQEKKKTIQKMEKIQKIRHLTIEAEPPKATKICFIIVECILFSLAIGFTIYEFIITNSNINTFIQDSQLLINVNQVQYLLCDSTYILSLTATQMAYTSNMTLPYKNFQSSVELLPEMQEMDEKYSRLDELMKIINPVFIDKISNDQLTQESLKVSVKYLLISNTKQYYLQQTDILQAVLQYISYGQDMSYRILAIQQPIQTLLQIPNYFFIFANSIELLPNKLLQIKDSILSSINSRLDTGFNHFLTIKLLNATLILLSAFGVILYYRYVYKHFIFQVLDMYHNIKVEQIKVYQEKCHKYKASLSDKTQVLEKSSNNANVTASGFNEILKNEELKLQKQQQSLSEHSDQCANEEEQKLVIKSEKDEEDEHFLNFEDLPNLCIKVIIFLVWVLFYGILLFALCYTYSNSTTTLQTQILDLNKYTIIQNAVVQMRLFSQLSLNMLGYWDDSYLSSINTQLERYIKTTVQYMDDKSLNLTIIQSQYARKYEEMRYLQSLVLTNSSILNELASQVEAQLEDIDSLVQFLSAQSLYYLPIVEAEAQYIATALNISISIELLFILVYWFFGVRIAYYQLLKQHESTHEMYNIISYNLRKEVEKT